MAREYCNCLNDMEKAAFEQLSKNDKYLNVSNVEFAKKSYVFSENVGPGIQTSVELEVHHEHKNGKPKKSKVNVMFTYCPFCGQKWRKDKEDNNG